MIQIRNSLSVDMIKIPNRYYEIGKYPITVLEYNKFLKDLNKYYDKFKENTPIVNISWYDAKNYCKWLSKKTNRIYRLPTKKEWKYACNLGQKSKWFFGNDNKLIDKYAWTYENSKGKIYSVGAKLANPLGIYDMYGLVWEWCENWDEDWGEKKLLKGGSYDNNIRDTQISVDFGDYPTIASYNVGFRIVRVL